MRAKSFAPLLACLALSACATPAPPIGRGLPRNFEDASHAFDERLRTRFPVGSSEADLVAELSREHFKIGPARPEADSLHEFSAIHGGEMFPACDLTWVVIWAAQGGKITRMRGSYYATCL